MQFSRYKSKKHYLVIIKNDISKTLCERSSRTNQNLPFSKICICAFPLISHEPIEVIDYIDLLARGQHSSPVVDLCQT